MPRSMLHQGTGVVPPNRGSLAGVFLPDEDVTVEETPTLVMENDLSASCVEERDIQSSSEV
jgi:hypothetical protein